MTNKKTPNTTQAFFATDSASVPKMQLTPGGIDNSTASADIPTMQLTPGTSPVNKSAAPSGGNKSTPAESK
jgi:hypothetical protein